MKLPVVFMYGMKPFQGAWSSVSLERLLLFQTIKISLSLEDPNG
jgi:hypothetical protein